MYIFGYLCLSHGMDKFKISTARNDISCNIISSWRNGAGHCCNECAQFSPFIAVPLHSGFVGYILFLDCVRIATLVIDKWPGRPWHSVLKRIAWNNGRSLSEKSIDFLRTQYSPDERKKNDTSNDESLSIVQQLHLIIRSRKLCLRLLNCCYQWVTILENNIIILS